MLKVGITGGIGSGKSVVCRVFETLGIPVFNADDAGKYLLAHDATVIGAVKALLGNEVYHNNQPDRQHIAKLVFANPVLLTKLNAIIHPAVIAYGNNWMQSQTSPYAIKEAAILFESGSYNGLDAIVGVYAPKEVRIARAMQRDDVTKEKVLERMANQMDEEEKMSRCDYVITNDGNTAIIPQVMDIHKTLLAKAGH
ncbi:dephospho-CoA kinase [Chitinophagaceae bacterium IBVUCB1]|nr:dephospho-CoA kinase [Chitinophagaceae bacterium IBVUCB1]